MVDIVA